MEKRITGHTELLGLIATPIRHSKSPVMHNAACRALGLDYAYLAFDIQPKALYLCFNHLLLLFTVFICIKPLHHLFVKDFLYLLIYLIKDIAYYDDIFLIKLFSFYLNKLKLSNFLPIIK